jgi:hypothetical protein
MNERRFHRAVEYPVDATWSRNGSGLCRKAGQTHLIAREGSVVPHDDQLP